MSEKMRLAKLGPKNPNFKNRFFIKNGIYHAKVKCPDCGILHDVSHKNYYAQAKGKRGLSFRCRKCGQLRAAKTRRNPNLKRMVNGYINFYRPENEMANKRGHVPEHRLIMSQKINRPLSSKEHVHHKDGNKLNNSINNLEIMSKHKHLSLHIKKRIEKGEIKLTHWGIQALSSTHKIIQ